MHIPDLQAQIRSYRTRLDYQVPVILLASIVEINPNFVIFEGKQIVKPLFHRKELKPFHLREFRIYIAIGVLRGFLVIVLQ